MAYEPKTWVCGETITADGLNNIEDGIQEALECCESGGDCGYSCIFTATSTLDEETVTTEDSGGNILGYLSNGITDSIIRVTFDGTEYICNKRADGGYGALYVYGYGADWSIYPFMIYYNEFYTENAGTYSVKIEAGDVDVSTTGCFAEAVKSFIETEEDIVLSYSSYGNVVDLIKFDFNQVDQKITDNSPIRGIAVDDKNRQYQLTYIKKINANLMELSFASMVQFTSSNYRWYYITVSIDNYGFVTYAYGSYKEVSVS